LLPPHDTRVTQAMSRGVILAIPVLMVSSSCVPF
jgi:hypothetical protein